MSSFNTAPSSSRQSNDRLGVDKSNELPPGAKRDRKPTSKNSSADQDDDSEWSLLGWSTKHFQKKRNNNNKEGAGKKEAEDDCKLFAFYIIKITLLSHS